MQKPLSPKWLQFLWLRASETHALRIFPGRVSILSPVWQGFSSAFTRSKPELQRASVAVSCYEFPVLRHVENNISCPLSAGTFLFPPSSHPLSKITDISQVHWTLKPSNHKLVVTNALSLKTKLKLCSRVCYCFSEKSSCCRYFMANWKRISSNWLKLSKWSSQLQFKEALRCTCWVIFCMPCTADDAECFLGLSAQSKKPTATQKRRKLSAYLYDSYNDFGVPSLHSYWTDCRRRRLHTRTLLAGHGTLEPVYALDSLCADVWLLLISEGNHWGYLDSFRETAPLALITLPKGKNRRLKIDNLIEFIMREREERTGENRHTPSMVILSACYFGHYLKHRGQLLARCLSADVW